MDFQNRVGSKQGGGGVAGNAETNQQRRERQRQLLSSKIDINSDPYVYRNRQGKLECRLCYTEHNGEASYIMHARASKHIQNLKLRIEADKQEQLRKEQKLANSNNNVLMSGGINDIPKKQFVKIGNPISRVKKVRDPITSQKGLLFQLQYRNIKDGVVPRYRLMSSFEQKIEVADSKYQYLVIAAEPYETVSFKIPSDPIDLSEGRIWDYWDVDTKDYFLQLFYLDQ